MNVTKRMKSLRAVGGLLLIGAIAWWGLGCETDSDDVSTVRNLSVDFSGVYDSDESTGQPFINPPNSGALVTQLTLRQNGDQLQAWDNNAKLFAGNIGNLDGMEASFTLTGETTAGNAVTINGTLVASGDSATMRANWIEPFVLANIVGDAAINPVQTNTTQVAISPTSAALTNDGQTVTFMASGGSGEYNWSVDNSNGSVNPMTGSSVTYTRNASGDNTITVSATSGGSATASISQP